jgi:hypothetical protein
VNSGDILTSCFIKLHLRSRRDSADGMAIGHGPDDRGRSSSPGRVKNFLNVGHTGSRAYCPMVSGCKAAGA